MYSVEMDVTPQIAEEFLRHNVHNRKLSRETIHAYSAMMKAGQWQRNPDGISFYEDGTMRNGQHRCCAVIESGATVKMYVTYDVPNESVLCDNGKRRSTQNAFQMSGLSSPIAQKSTVAAVNRLFYLCGVKPGDSFLVKFAKAEEESLCNVYKITSKGETDVPRRAAVFAAVWVAYKFGVSEEVLDRFATVIGTGFYGDDGETSAIVIRNSILQKNACRDKPSQHILFRSTLKAIYDFEHGVPRKRDYQDRGKVPYWDTIKANVLMEYIPKTILGE